MVHLALALAALPALAAEEPLRFERVGGGGALEAENITALFQDAAGFLWIGSREGLTVYDGYAFTRFEHDVANPASISDNAVRTIYEDRAGRLWIGTNTGGLDRLDRATGAFTAYRSDSADPASLSHDSVYAIVEDPDGAIWAGTQRGLNRFDPKTGKFERFLAGAKGPASLPSDFVTGLALERDGSLWLGTFQGDIVRRDRATGAMRRYQLPPSPADPEQREHALGMARGAGSDLWISTSRGVVRLDAETGALERIAVDARETAVPGVMVDPRGPVWAASLGSGLIEIDAATRRAVVHHNRSERADPADLVHLDDVIGLAAGPGDILWVGTWGAGLQRVSLEATPFGAIRQGTPGDEGLPNADVTALAVDGGGKLYVGTFGGGVAWRPAGGRAFALPLGPAAGDLRTGGVVSILPAGDGGSWVGTMEGLHRVDAAGRELLMVRHDRASDSGLGPGYVTALHRDREGNLWVGTGGGGLHRLDASGGIAGVFRHDARHPESLSDDFVTSIFEDKDGTLWVGTRSGGLDALDRARRRFTRFGPDPSRPDALGHHYVTSIVEDARGRLWVGTGGGGLHRVDRTEGAVKFVRYDDRRGLIDNNVMSIAEDDDGSLWLGTRRGLARFDPATETFAGFTVADGLAGSEFAAGAAARDRSRIYLGSSRGIVVVPRGTRFPEARAYPTRVTALTTLDGPVAAGTPPWLVDRVTMRRRDVLFVNFAVLDFREPARHRYAYQIDDHDGGWIDLSSRHELTVTGLAPGRHQLKIRGRSAGGVWSDASSPLKVEVIPPVWMTWWFRAAVVAAIAAAAFAGHRLRTGGLERRNRELVDLQGKLRAAYEGLRSLTRRLEAAKEGERRHLARELHDEMGQALTAAKINLQLLAGLSDPEQRRKRIEDTVGLVDLMIGQVRALSLDLRPPLLDELGLVPALKGYVESVSERASIDVAVDADPLPRDTPAEVQIAAFRIVQEALTNALRHADAKSVRILVRAAVPEDGLTVSITDDGRGFDVAQAMERAAGGQHLGLLGIVERVRGLGGDAAITSTPGHGTTVRAHVPLSH